MKLTSESINTAIIIRCNGIQVHTAALFSLNVVISALLS